MSNDVPANAGGMPAISRRAVLIGAAAAALPTTTAGAADQDNSIAVLIENFETTRETWLATSAPGSDIDAEGPEYDAHRDAIFAFISFRCVTPHQVRAKLLYALSDSDMMDAIKCDGAFGGERYSHTFLKSLITLEAA